MTVKTEALAQTLNMSTKFANDLHNLLAVMGKSDVKIVAPGAAVNIYKTSAGSTVSDVAEGAEIANLNIKPVVDKTVELTYKKFRNLCGIESIGKYGYDVAVGMTSDEVLRRMQKYIRNTIYAGIATGTGTATGATFQAAVANAWAKVQEAFEDEAFTPVFFAHPTTAAAYLGTANITVQTAFGLSYIENFMGLGNLIIDSNVAAGKVIGTAAENIDLIACDMNAIGGLEMTTSEDGVAGFHIGEAYDHASVETVAYSGIEAFPVYLDRVCIATISA